MTTNVEASSTTAKADPTTTTTVPAAAAFDAQRPDEVVPPPVEGNGLIKPQPVPALPEGYIEEEYFVAGTATSFDPVAEPSDGKWEATPGATAEYRTRVIVRRPANAADFSGTTLVEWFNVSAIEASPDWTYLVDEIAREGHAYIGVSAQSQGVEGGATLLDVNVDRTEAEEAGVNTNKGGLVNSDPARYGSLHHPGDAYSYDIFSQVGRVVQNSPELLLGDLKPTQVIAVGESQSAGFMTTLINAVHPLAPTFDGFFVHSRAAIAPPLDGDYTRIRRELAEGGAAAAISIREDIDVPVFLFATETDLTRLRYATARQDDSDKIYTWEVAGTAHADAHLLRTAIGGPRDPSVGKLLGCGPINTGPQKETLSAAFHHLVNWVGGGSAPPAGERIELSSIDPPTIARDARGNALGGVRNPLVDAPVVALSGDTPDDPTATGGAICWLFGTTVPFDQATLDGMYGNADNYVERFRTSADDLVKGGFLLQPDADELVAEAEANRTLFSVSGP